MNAKDKNKSERALFLSGGRLDVLLWGHQEAQRQFAEARNEARARYQSLHPETVAACPCGCGLEGAVCDAQISKVNAANEECPF
ncbi:MAG: hypothetical protein MOB07_26245 [Acidobacteria bacterium]|nr:hypothetical protein [Acidobacteriota bacterium]